MLIFTHHRLCTWLRLKLPSLFNNMFLKYHFSSAFCHHVTFFYHIQNNDREAYEDHSLPNVSPMNTWHRDKLSRLLHQRGWYSTTLNRFVLMSCCTITHYITRLLPSSCKYNMNFGRSPRNIVVTTSPASSTPTNSMPCVHLPRKPIGVWKSYRAPWKINMKDMPANNNMELVCK